MGEKAQRAKNGIVIAPKSPRKECISSSDSIRQCLIHSRLRQKK